MEPRPNPDPPDEPASWPKPDRIALTIAETCECLGVGRATVDRGMRDGSIPFTKIGGRVLIPVKALEDSLNTMALLTR